MGKNWGEPTVTDAEANRGVRAAPDADATMVVVLRYRNGRIESRLAKNVRVEPRSIILETPAGGHSIPRLVVERLAVESTGGQDPQAFAANKLSGRGDPIYLNGRVVGYIQP